MVGDDGIYLRHMRDVAKTTFIEFRCIEDRNRLAGLCNHCLIEHGFFQIRGGDTGFEGERIHAKEEFVVAEMGQRIQRQRSDSGVAVDTQVPAKDYDGEAVVA